MNVKAIARHALLAVLPIGFLLAAMSGTDIADPTMDRTCTAQWCQNGRANAYMESEYRSMIAAQLDEYGCDTTTRLSERVAVRDAKGGDSGVVRVVTFDEAWNAAQAGKVYVVGWCG